MRGCTVHGSSCPSDLKRARRQARQDAIEMARGEALGQAIADDSRSALDACVRVGARQMLQRALEYEVETFLAEHADRIDERGRKQVVRNGYLPARSIMTGAGPLEVQQPRVRDKAPRVDERVVFTSPLEVVRYPGPALRAENLHVKTFDDSLAALAREMFDLMYRRGPGRASAARQPAGA